MKADPYDELEEHYRLQAEADSRRRARREAWIEHAKEDGRWTELERLRDLVRRLTEAYGLMRGVGGLDHALLREATEAAESMPPPWEAEGEK